MDHFVGFHSKKNEEQQTVVDRKTKTAVTELELE